MILGGDVAMNNKEKGTIRLFVYRKKNSKVIVGVCLDFGIIVTGNDCEIVKKDLMRATRGYLAVVRQEKLNDALLNNQADEECYSIYQKVLKSEQQVARQEKPSYSGLSVFDIQFLAINNLCHA